MIKNTERNLSLTLALTSLLIFILTLVGVFYTNLALSLVWNGLFIISWILMLVFSLLVLVDKRPYKFSILVALITGLAFLALASHALIIIARFIPQVPNKLIIPSYYLVKYNQLIFYTSLIVVYFIHYINYMKLNPARITKDKNPKKEDVKRDKKAKQKEVSQEDLAILNSHLEDDDDLLFDETEDPVGK